MDLFWNVKGEIRDKTKGELLGGMITFLFWNLQKKPLEGLITNIALRYGVDILIFAECSIAPDKLLAELNRPNKVQYDYAPSIGCEKIKIFTRFSRKMIPSISEDHRLTIRHLRLPGCEDVILSATHFVSKNYWRDSSQISECFELSSAIRYVENQIGHSRTILVGDLNMNPFEAGIVNANGLHGIASRQIAQKKVRRVQNKPYPFFYNPMWNLLGDFTPGPPGTFYCNGAEHTEYFWYMFDQVLIRPELIDAFSYKDLPLPSGLICK